MNCYYYYYNFLKAGVEPEFELVVELEVELTLTGTRALLGSLITLPPNRWERYHVGINDHQ